LYLHLIVTVVLVEEELAWIWIDPNGVSEEEIGLPPSLLEFQT